MLVSEARGIRTMMKYDSHTNDARKIIVHRRTHFALRTRI